MGPSSGSSVRVEGGGPKKHEIYAAEFGCHLFYDLFLQGRGGGHGLLGPTLRIRYWDPFKASTFGRTRAFQASTLLPSVNADTQSEQGLLSSKQHQKTEKSMKTYLCCMNAIKIQTKICNIFITVRHVQIQLTNSLYLFIPSNRVILLNTRNRVRFCLDIRHTSSRSWWLQQTLRAKAGFLSLQLLISAALLTLYYVYYSSNREKCWSQYTCNKNYRKHVSWIRHMKVRLTNQIVCELVWRLGLPEWIKLYATRHQRHYFEWRDLWWAHNDFHLK